MIILAVLTWNVSFGIIFVERSLCGLIEWGSLLWSQDRHQLFMLYRIDIVLPGPQILTRCLILEVILLRTCINESHLKFFIYDSYN